jgi:hypothetical protein
MKVSDAAASLFPPTKPRPHKLSEMYANNLFVNTNDALPNKYPQAGSVFKLNSAKGASRVATGGNVINEYNGYRSHVFTSSGTFVANAPLTVDFMIIGGGGCGGTSIGAGGGAGGVVIRNSVSVPVGTYNVVVGTGAISSANANTYPIEPTASSFFGFTANGGGNGIGQSVAWINRSTWTAGRSGGSGGGGTRHVLPGGASTQPNTGWGFNLGFAGGAGSQNDSITHFTGGGGGGAGGAGGSGASPGSPGVGGVGIQNTFETGEAKWYAGGGGGSLEYQGTFGGSAGGSGVGGAGTGGNGGDGVQNTGSGGGGGVSKGGNGANGIVIIRYLLTTLPSPVIPAPALCYSLRKVVSTYNGPIIRIRRSSDNQEVDLYSTIHGDMQLSTGMPALTWIGTSIAYVTTWYDQSGNTRHATQATSSLQPTLNISTKSIDFPSNNNANNTTNNGVHMVITGGMSFIVNSSYTYMIMCRRMNLINNEYIVGGSSITNNNNAFFGWISSNVWRHGHYANDADFSVRSVLPTAPEIFVGTYTLNTGRALRVEGTPIIGSGATGALASSSGTYYIGRLYSGSFSTYFTGKVYEVIMHSSVLNSAQIDSYENSALAYRNNFLPCLPVPPIGMTTNAASISGLSYGNGTYNATVTSVYDGFSQAYKAFDYVSSTYWNSGSGKYDTTSGLYIGAVTTNDTKGEYVQLQVPSALTLRKYKILGNHVAPWTTQSPRAWVLFGSNNGTSWTLLDEREGISTSTEKEFILPLNKQVQYTYFRLVVTATEAAPPEGVATIHELSLFCRI